MASDRMLLREGPHRGTISNGEEDDWQTETAFDFMDDGYPPPITRSSEGELTPFTPYPFHSGVPAQFVDHAGIPYDAIFPSPNAGINDSFFSDSPHSSQANDYFASQPTPPQALVANTQRHLQPRPSSFNTSALHPEPSNEPARHHLGTPIAPQPLPVSGTGRRGRGGPLEEQTRHEAARNRADAACLYHMTRKTKCTRPETPEDFSVCGDCKAANRFCFRPNQKCKEALFIGRPLLSNSKTQLPLLVSAGSTALTKQLRFSIEVRYPDEAPLSFEVDQSPRVARESNENDLEKTILGSISDKPFLELLESMTSQAPITEKLQRLAMDCCDHSTEKIPLRQCPIKELLNSVRNCVLTYRLLELLPDAQLRTPVQTTDQHAAKCFVISLTYSGIHKLREDIKFSTEQLFKVIQSHRRVYADPSYERVKTALVAFCGLIRAIAKSQKATTADNVMVDAIAGLLPIAEPFARELEMLGKGFCAITDPAPGIDEFHKSAEVALKADSVPRLVIVLDPSGSESSLRGEGALPTQSMQSIPPWSAAKDGHSRTRSLHAQPVRPMFTSNRLSADARRVQHGSTRTSPSASDSENGGTWDLFSEKQSKSLATSSPLSESRRSARPYKRERSDSLRTSAAQSGSKRPKSP